MKPAILLHKNDFQKYVNKPMKDLCADLTALRIAVKNAVDYPYGNQHFYIENIYGKATLTIGVYTYKGSEMIQKPDGYEISFWNYWNGRALSPAIRHINDEPFTQKDYETIQTNLAKVTQGLTQCTVCHEWVDEYQSYSYAGAACDACYEPTKHKQPETT